MDIIHIKIEMLKQTSGMEIDWFSLSFPSHPHLWLRPKNPAQNSWTLHYSSPKIASQIWEENNYSSYTWQSQAELLIMKPRMQHVQVYCMCFLSIKPVIIKLFKMSSITSVHIWTTFKSIKKPTTCGILHGESLEIFLIQDYDLG